MLDDHEELEELLCTIASDGVLADLDHPVWSNPRFVAWLGDAGRAAEEQSTRADQREEWLRDERERGRALLSRAFERRHGVRSSADGPSYVDVTRVAPATRRRHAAVFDLAIAAGVGRELWEETPEVCIEVPSDLPDGEYVALRIAGDSMTPLLNTGDMVLVRRETAAAPETVIVARVPEQGYVCKRVSRVTNSYIELDSLAAGHGAIRIPRRQALIFGTVLMVWRRSAPAR